LLDEPTAALDPLTEHALYERYAASAHEAGTRTGGITVLVSHRFSTVRMAELSLVVSEGRTAESGDHQTLTALQAFTPSCSRSRRPPTAEHDRAPTLQACMCRATTATRMSAHRRARCHQERLRSGRR
jgi:ABC-type protease/lipase transport system fused ATPase/permease subunit